ncbi:MAG: hypothetical protein BZ137_02220 [Methanosphaera sp. rholeuAM130]|nr:MAG: hypothetical protein BZ137_02220 [Methanosphaera sp. rholeuAM130]
MNEKIKCPKCEYENPINFTSCIKCNHRLKNAQYYTENYKDFYELFSPKNLDILNNTQLTDTAYDTIIYNIINIGEDYIKLLPDEASISNLFNITKPYVKIQYDNSKNFPAYLSYYSYNNILIKKTTHASLIPTAILHEFTHHLFNEIIKQSLMHLLNHEKNLLIESFAWYLTLENRYIELSGEFMAHKVQEHFLPDDFEGFTSVIKLLEDNPNLDEQKVKESLYFGNSIAKDIIYILEHFITPKASMYGNVFENQGIEYPIVDISNEEKISRLYSLITDAFNKIINDKVEMQAVLSQMNKNYIYLNC